MATAQQPNLPETHHIALRPPTEELPASAPTFLLLQQAIAQGVSIDQLERFQAMHERWEANEARKAFIRAKAAFKAEAPTILKNAHVKIEPKDQSKRGAEYDHATLDHVCDAVIPLLAKHGFDHDWKMKKDGEWITVTCILKHIDGHFEERSLPGAPDNTGFKNPVQQIASTVTYLQRYTLLAVCGLAAKGTDNDGRGARTIEAGLSDNREQVNHVAGIPRERMEEMLGELRRASSVEQLIRVFKFAYSEASKVNDRRAQATYITAKDTRRKELR